MHQHPLQRRCFVGSGGGSWCWRGCCGSSFCEMHNRLTIMVYIVLLTKTGPWCTAFVAKALFHWPRGGSWCWSGCCESCFCEKHNTHPAPVWLLQSPAAHLSNWTYTTRRWMHPTQSDAAKRYRPGCGRRLGPQRCAGRRHAIQSRQLALWQPSALLVAANWENRWVTSSSTSADPPSVEPRMPNSVAAASTRDIGPLRASLVFKYPLGQRARDLRRGHSRRTDRPSITRGAGIVQQDDRCAVRNSLRPAGTSQRKQITLVQTNRASQYQVTQWRQNGKQRERCEHNVRHNGPEQKDNV